MADWYNLSGLGNSASVYGITDTLNTASNGLFAIMFVIVSAVFIMKLMKDENFKVMLTTATGTCLVELLIFYGLGWATWLSVQIGFGISVGMMLWVIFGND